MPAKKQTMNKEEQRIAKEFKAKLEELREWGYTEGIVIDAHMTIKTDGIFPYVSYRYMTDEEIEAWKTWSVTAAKTKMDIARSEVPKV